MTARLLILLSLSLGLRASMPSVPVDPPSTEKKPADVCHSLPSNPDFFTAQQMDFVCNHREKWMNDVARGASKDFIQHTTENQRAYLRSIERCSRRNCMGDSRRQKRASRKTIRKEIRMMSNEERTATFEAMNALKATKIDNITAWDLHTLVHYPDSAPGAHWGPAFLPWHREFLRQFEIALQRERPLASLPFWDSTLDEGLPRPADSVLWTEELLGNGNGYVRTGPFKDWDTNVLMPLSDIPVKRLYRSTGGREQDRLLSPRDIDWVLSRQNYSELTFCHDKTFESMHGLSHVWVGGFMYVIRVSPNDPAFYMHHAFVDQLWERFRMKQQTRETRESEYATKTCSNLQSIDAQMKPFAISNREGLSNKYTEEWYEYDVIQHCTSDFPSCRSEYIFCDQKAWKCRSKVVLGGNCTGFENTQICFKSVCVKGECRLPPRVETAQRAKAVASNEAAAAERDGAGQPPPLLRNVIWTKTILLDEDGKGIRDVLASVTVHSSDGQPLTGTAMNTTVFMNVTRFFPELPGMIYVPLPKARPGQMRKVSLTAKDSYGRYCQAQCFNVTVERHQVCDGSLNVSSSLLLSSPFSFTHDPRSRRFLDADLSVHPRSIPVHSPYIAFVCARKLVTSAMILAVGESEVPPIERAPHVWIRVSLSRPSLKDLVVESSSNGGDEIWQSPALLAQSPVDPTVFFVRITNPERFSNGVHAKVSFLLHGVRLPCNIRCTNEDGWSESCNGSVFLHSSPSRSQEATFSSESERLPLLGWRMQGHPATWTHRVPFLSFVC